MRQARPRPLRSASPYTPRHRHAVPPAAPTGRSASGHHHPAGRCRPPRAALPSRASQRLPPLAGQGARPANCPLRAGGVVVVLRLAQAGASGGGGSCFAAVAGRCLWVRRRLIWSAIHAKRQRQEGLCVIYWGCHESGHHGDTRKPRCGRSGLTTPLRPKLLKYAKYKVVLYMRGKHTLHDGGEVASSLTAWPGGPMNNSLPSTVCQRGGQSSQLPVPLRCTVPPLAAPPVSR